MGYFSNGSEGMDYYEEFCSRCVHDKDQSCPVWNAHLIHNYAECNKTDSILHMLIPLNEDKLCNEACLMFIEKPAVRDLFEEAA